MKEYRNRIADKLLEKKLKGKGAVLIQGPKWCGKTTTAEQISNSILYMSNPSFLMVLTATGKYAYKREDGVYVVPVGCLKN